MRQIDPIPTWMRTTLMLAAAYNLVWGALVVLAPRTTLGWIGLDNATVALWQCIGMIVGVYGVGYACAALDPRRHWPIVLVGLLGKIFGPIGFLQGWWAGHLPLQMGWTILTNDLIWWLPFGLILLHAWRQRRSNRTTARSPTLAAAPSTVS